MANMGDFGTANAHYIDNNGCDIETNIRIIHICVMQMSNLLSAAPNCILHFAPFIDPEPGKC